MMYRSLLTIALLGLCLSLGGCWDHQPPEDTAFILMIGLDVDPERPLQTAVTQLAVLPSGLAAGDEGGQPEGTPFYLLSTTARTLEAAQFAVVDHMSRLPRLDHLDALILGEEFARRGNAVEPSVAWALRHPQIRPAIFLFVAEESAQQFLDARPALDPLPGAALAGLMRNAARVPYVFPVRAYEFAGALLSERKDGALPMVRRVNPLSVKVPPEFDQQPYIGSTGSDGGKGGQEEGTADPMESQIKLIGMAVFKGGTMVGSVKQQDALGLTWIRGNSKITVTVEHPEHSENFISALAIRSTAQRKARLDGDGVILSIKIEASMDVWGEGKLKAMGVGPTIKGVEKELAETISAQIRRTMKHLQLLEADIFGFAEELYRSAPKDWEKVSDRWDELYRDAELDIQVKATVLRTGLSR